jgi:hypothetical protein
MNVHHLIRVKFHGHIFCCKIKDSCRAKNSSWLWRPKLLRYAGWMNGLHPHPMNVWVDVFHREQEEENEGEEIRATTHTSQEP